MKSSAVRERVRCRAITQNDLASVADLLSLGFKGRSRSWFERGLTRMSERIIPEGTPQFGYCLDIGERLVGAILLLSSLRVIAGQPSVFCNVSSWYVDPDYRAYAQLLVSVALRNKNVTYTNVSPAPHTWGVVENQGYTRYCGGLFFAAAFLRRPVLGATIERFDWAKHSELPERDLLSRHLEWGCTPLVISHSGRQSGYVFQRYHIRSGKVPLPAMFVLHAPDRQQLVHYAGNISRYFLSAGAPMLVMDADGPVGGLAGLYTAARGRKYFKGPRRPAFCDLSDSEYAIFGV